MTDKILIRVCKKDILNGDSMHSSKCPVALAIKRKTGEEKVLVFHTFIFLGEKAMPTPKRVERFMNRFDSDKKVNPFRFYL